MKIYIDNCCLNRPFDNQANLRVHLEAEAIKTIITLVEQQKFSLISSKILQFEIAKLTDEVRKKELIFMESLAGEVCKWIRRLQHGQKSLKNGEFRLLMRCI